MIDCLTPWMLILNLFQSHQCAEIYNSSLPTDPVSLQIYLPYLFKTFILEFPVYYLFLRKDFKLPKIIFLNFILNIATHPMVFFGWPSLLSLFDANYLTYLVIAEIFAPTVEAAILVAVFKMNLRQAVIAGLSANLLSWSIGVYWT